MLALILSAVIVAPSPKLINIVWDGAPDWVIDRMLKEGKLPNVARLAATGFRAETCIPAWPSKTAVGHASIFTASWPDQHGVSNNTVGLLPRYEHSLSESMRGFDGRALQNEPIWVTAARQGKKVVTLSAACSFPPDPFVAQLKQVKKERNWVGFSGFEQEWAQGKMINEPGEVEVAGSTFSVRLHDDPTDPKQGPDSVIIQRGDEIDILKPKPAGDTKAWSHQFEIRKAGSTANVYFRLFSLKDGRLELYQRKLSPIYGTESDEAVNKYVRAYGGFHDDAFGLYERGTFGNTIFQGGEGEAEKRILEIVEQDCEFLKRGFDYGWKAWKPDILFHYTPMSDSAGHTWMGALDPAIPGYDPAIAARIWPYYERVFELQDGWLGHMMDHCGKNTVVALMSDHGMAGARQYVHVNNALEAAGLLKRTSSGAIDWTVSQAAVPSWSDFFVTVNGTDRKGGIVSAADRESVLERAEQALLRIVDPQTDKPIITSVFRADRLSYLGIGGQAGGDLYFEMAPGYYPSNRANRSTTSPYGSEIGGGVHGFFPYRREMGAIFYASGPGVEHRSNLAIRHVDIMPLLCRAIGITAPNR
ncbi:MAG: alkaline phosphatase family protein [Fimbriimonadaceae bacterium]